MPSSRFLTWLKVQKSWVGSFHESMNSSHARENEFFLYFGTESIHNFSEGSSSSVTARKLWQESRGGQSPIDTIVPQRGLPKHSNPEWGWDFA